LSQFNQKVVKETRARNTGKFNNSAGKGLHRGSQKQKSAQDNSFKPLEKGGSPLDRFKPQVDWSSLAEKNQGGNNLDVSRTSDYLKDTEQSIQTQLSTREFLYYSYFKRIKSRIQQYWEPSIKKKIEKMVSSGRQLASAEDRITKLLIVLNEQGNLVQVKIITESGVQDLDDAAKEAFESAAPFPNPPTGIIEKDGTIKIRWDFVLEA
jgi:protein TonB